MGNYLRKEGAPIDFLYLVDIAKVGIYFYFARKKFCKTVKKFCSITFLRYICIVKNN